MNAAIRAVTRSGICNGFKIKGIYRGYDGLINDEVKSFTTEDVSNIVQKCGIPLYEYTPSQVKLAVTGYGKAEKRQVMDMTKRLLKLKAVPRPDDAADALALALCHARSFTSRLPQMVDVKETV